ncbi:MAG: DUF1190 domain-containing protein [Candidatus Sericytochromatia bacterium]|nr:DUF1190 domain-containing protein [Candidatus Sericytochromatia bacterium]
MLKRSRRVTPAILGSMMSLAALTACADATEEAAVFETMDQCINAGYSEPECKEGFAQAEADHQAVAPRFDSEADCEAEFGSGACESPDEYTTDTSTGSDSHGQVRHSYMPMMAGVMIGSALSQPLYRTYQNGAYGAYMTNRGMPVATKPGRQRISREVARTRPTRTTTTLKRGGFGSMSRSSVAS